MKKPLLKITTIILSLFLLGFTLPTFSACPWGRPLFTITFNSNGGSAVENQYVYALDWIFRPPNPTKYGYDFAGWFTDDTTDTPFDFNNAYARYSKTLYARWLPIDYNNGGNDIDPVERQEFASFFIYMPSIIPPPIGQSFIPFGRYDWENASFSVQGYSIDTYNITNISGRIRGRGNSTWNVGTRVNSPSTQKWPFRIRLDTPRSILGMTSVSTDWSFIANLSDYTLLRNEAAKYLARQLPSMNWQTQSRFVHVYFNGQYRGVYWVAEQLEVDNLNNELGRPQDFVSGRVPLTYSSDPTQSEYFLELDVRANVPPTNDPNRIMVEGIDYILAGGRIFDMRFPDGTRATTGRRNATPAHFDYARSFLTRVHNAILGGNWNTITSLVDVDSFIDFYLVHEFFKNIDSGGLSVHMTIRNTPNGRRLFKGPIWDFDLTAGNNAVSADGWSQATYNHWAQRGAYTSAGIWVGFINAWYRYLLRVPQFFNRARNRFDSMAFGFAGRPAPIENMISHLQQVSTIYQYEFNRNFDRWNLLGRRTWAQPPSVVALTTHAQNVDHLINWFLARRDQLAHFFNNGSGANNNATLWEGQWL